MQQNLLQTPIEYLKGVGPNRGELLRKELGIFKYGDLVNFFPNRYIDRTRYYKVNELQNTVSEVQIIGKIIHIKTVEFGKNKKRLVATFVDDTGQMELVWFQGHKWIRESLKLNEVMVIFGKCTSFNGTFNMAHPEIELLSEHQKSLRSAMQAIYPSTETLANRGVSNRVIIKMMQQLFLETQNLFSETLPDYLLDELKLISKKAALFNIHFPQSSEALAKAQFRLKFEELFFKDEIALGRQIYIVYPLIQESEKMDFKDLMDGYESISRDFPLPEYSISILHGKMKPADNESEMKRFAEGKTNIMVATTVIEVGVNVPNASVMIIESAERFGLSQLHQLRGRVGRGAEQSYCVLMTNHKLSSDSKTRMETMVSTNDGFEIAEVDLKLRGPGDLMGTQQSGVLNLQIADIVKDRDILMLARNYALKLLREDASMQKPEHATMRTVFIEMTKKKNIWNYIS